MEKPNQIVNNFAALDDFNGGLFVQKINAALTEAALSAIQTGKMSVVEIKISMVQIEGINQVAIAPFLKKTIPHARGDTTDRSSDKRVPMFVHSNGQLSPFTEDQMGFEFSRKTKVEPKP